MQRSATIVAITIYGLLGYNLGALAQENFQKLSAGFAQPAVTEGAQIYAANCAECHGENLVSRHDFRHQTARPQ